MINEMVLIMNPVHQLHSRYHISLDLTAVSSSVIMRFILQGFDFILLSTRLRPGAQYAPTGSPTAEDMVDFSRISCKAGVRKWRNEDFPRLTKYGRGRCV